jgi:hypothetical protein
MHYVSLIVEFLRGRPAVVFWAAALSQAALWFLVPALFYSAPPGDVPILLAVGHHFTLGSYLGPPLASWLGELAFRIAGIYGVYLLSQACIVLALWAVFMLGRSIVGMRHAVLAVLLMTGIAAYTVPSPNFGAAILALPFWALALLHYWRALGEDKRGSWFLLAFDLGCLLLTTYIGLVLCAVLLLFTLATERGRASLRHIEPWCALVLLAIVIFPHAMWLAQEWPQVVTTLTANAPNASLPPAAWLALVLLLSHLGAGLLVLLAGGWRVRKRDRAPEIDRNPVEPLGRRYVYALALAPIVIALALVAAQRAVGPFDRIGPLIVLTCLAVIVAAGNRIHLYRENMVSTAWVGLLTLPPLAVALATWVLPWVSSAELSVGQPASAMGQFFGDSFQRRTGQPLALIGSGDDKLASLIALSAPSRPDVYFSARPDRTPWTSAAALRASGGVLVWRATDTAGTPPSQLKAEFPDMVPELPRAFARPMQGFLPLMRIGWAVLRPAQTPR